MNGIQYALGRVHDGECEISTQLLKIADRHRAEHEVYHVAQDLASWSREHVRLVAHHAQRYELQLSDEPGAPHAPIRQMREAVSSAIGRRPETGLVLLEDLRDLYLRASQNSLAWEMLAQVAQARHERQLLALSEECHPQTLRQIRWANTSLKVHAPQVLASL